MAAIQEKVRVSEKRYRHVVTGQLVGNVKDNMHAPSVNVYYKLWWHRAPIAKDIIENGNDWIEVKNFFPVHETATF